MKFGLPPHLIESLCAIFAQYPEIEEVVIYGSRAKGSYREGSDIDLALKGENVTDETRGNVWLDIDASDSPYLADVCVFHHLNSPSLIDHINRVGKTFYAKDRADAIFS